MINKLIKMGRRDKSLRKHLKPIIDHLLRIGNTAPRRFFHATDYRSMKNILKEGWVGSMRTANASFSEIPLPQFGDVILVFSPRIEDQLIKIQYDERWFYLHPRIAEYVIGPHSEYVGELDVDSREYRIQTAKDAVEMGFEWQREWVSKDNLVRYEPQDLLAILATDSKLREKIQEYIEFMYPEKLNHVQVGTH